MDSTQYKSYTDMFTKKLENCEKKKDYKKLCKEMITQFEVIDKIDITQFKLFSSIMGAENYIKVVTLAAKIYLLQEQGCDLVDIITEQLDDY